MIERIKKEYPTLITIFIIFSVGGFVVETICNILLKGFVIDKGYLMLPLCPIYGFSVLFLILCIGLPFQGKWANMYNKKEGKKRILFKCLTLFSYTVFCTLIVVAIEYLSGQLFYYVFDIRIWHYPSTADTFWNGFVSRKISDLWFVLIMILAPAVVTPLYRIFSKANQKALKIFSFIMVNLIIIDFIITTIVVLVTGNKIDIFNFYL